MSKLNPLKQYVDNIFESVNYYNGVVFHLNDYFKHFKQLFEAKFKGSEIYKLISAGTGIPIRKLNEFPKDGWARYYPTSSFETQGETYFNTFEEIKNINYGWVISQTFESFEKTLFDMTSRFLLDNPQYDDNKVKSKKSPKYLTYNKTSIEYWKGKLRYDYQTLTELLKFIRNISFNLKNVEIKNNRNINLCDWMFVSEKVRNVIVHQNLNLNLSVIKKWDKNKREILEYYYPGILFDLYYQLKFSKESVGECLTIFLEYFYLVFESLSKCVNYDSDILREAV